MTAQGCYDATCPKCKTRFGWRGNLLSKPACPKCGHKDDPEVLAKEHKEITWAIEQMHIHTLFHKAWGQAKESPEYDKKVWKDLDKALTPHVFKGLKG